MKMILTITMSVALVLSGLLAMSTMTGIGLATAQTVDNATVGNMTGAGNMTNMTDMNATGSISQIAPENEQESEGEGDIFIANPDNQGGNTGSGGEGDLEYRAGEGPKLDFGNNQGGDTDSDEDDD
jgi:hypothetical protein